MLVTSTIWIDALRFWRRTTRRSLLWKLETRLMGRNKFCGQCLLEHPPGDPCLKPKPEIDYARLSYTLLERLSEEVSILHRYIVDMQLDATSRNTDLRGQLVDLKHMVNVMFRRLERHDRPLKDKILRKVT